MGLLLFEVFPAFLGLTHTVTHTRKKADGVSGRESAKDYVTPQQKGPESAKQRHSRGFQSLGKDRETCPCRNSTIINEPDSSANARNIPDIQYFYCVFQFATFGLTTYLPTDRENRGTLDFAIRSPSAYVSQLALPISSSPFLRQSPLSSGGSSPPTAAHIPRWCWHRHCGDAFCRLARRGSSGPPTDGR